MKNQVINDIKAFDDAVTFLKQNAQGIPQLYTINLATANDDLLLTFTGSLIYVWDATDDDATITVKFNRKDLTGVPMKKQQGLRTPFDKIFLTNAAQPAKTVTILIGTVSPEFMNVIDNRAVVSADLSEIRNQLEGDTVEDDYDKGTIGTTQAQVMAANADRHSLVIQADIANSGFVYVGFGTGVLATKAFAKLSPGQSFSVDDYRGAIHVIGSSAGQNYYYGEW